MHTPSCRSLYRALAGDIRGTAAVETALLSPVLILLFLGTVEVSQLIRAESKLARAAQTIQDTVAGQKSASTGSLLNAFGGGQVVMTPFDGTKMSAAIASVIFDGSGHANTVDWQQVENNGSSMPLSTACTTVAGMSVVGNDSVIVVKVTYSYIPIVSYLFGKSYTLTQMAYGRPRNVPAVQGPSSSNGTTGNC